MFLVKLQKKRNENKNLYINIYIYLVFFFPLQPTTHGRTLDRPEKTEASQPHVFNISINYNIGPKTSPPPCKKKIGLENMKRKYICFPINAIYMYLSMCDTDLG